MNKSPSRVSCWPRPVLEKIIPPEGAVLISVYDRSEEPLDAHAGWKAVLKLRFHDTDGSQMGLEVFNEQQARCVVEFIKQNADASSIYVHCAAGQSRSAAIAMAIGEMQGLRVFKQQLPLPSNYALYNRRVYRELLNAFHADADQEAR